MKKPKLFACVLLLAVPAVHGQSVYKCPGPGGTTVFQQQPCAGGVGGAVTVRPGTVIESNPAGDRGVRAEHARRQAMERARATGQLFDGMTESEVYDVLGNPSAVNTTVSSGRTSRQLVYRYQDGSTRYVYIDNGRLSAQQFTESSAAPRPTAPCYSEMEIRNAGVGLTSYSTSPEERRRREAELERMRNCRR